jgi:thermitase
MKLGGIVNKENKKRARGGLPQWLQRALPLSASILAGVLLLLGLLLGSLGLALSRAEAGGMQRSAGADILASAEQIPLAGSSGQSPVPTRIVVKLSAGAYVVSDAAGRSELVAARGHRTDLSQHGVHSGGTVGVLGLQVLDAPDQATLDTALAALQSDPGVVWAEETQPVFASAIPNDPYYSLEWAPAKVGLPTAWNTTTGSANVTVAVVDTGLDGAISDFAGRIVSPYSVIDSSSAWPYWDDTHGHGTAVAGVAASQGNNGVGIAGTAWGVNIMPVKISASGSSDDFTLAQGVIYAVNNGAEVINISFGGPNGSSTMQSAINYALGRGVVVVASAGNSGAGSGVSYPAAYPGVISVGATDSSDAVASFSSTGLGLAVSAPGVSILTWNPNAGGSMLSYWNGTSFSSPLVAGVAALMLSVNSSLTPAQVTSILEQTALDLGSAGWDAAYGYGRVRADAAVASAAGQSTTTTTPSSTTSTTVPQGGTVRYEDTDPRLIYSGSWATFTGASYSGGSMKQTSISGSTVTINFSGTGLTWITRKFPSSGRARVTLDGGTPVTVDLYSASQLYQQPAWTTGTLAYGPHTVVIAYTGQKNPSATSTYVNIDAVDVTGVSTGSIPTTTTTTAAPTTTSSTSTSTTSTSTTTTTTAPVTTTSTSTTTTSSSTTISTTSTTVPPGSTVRYEETNPLLIYAGSWATFTGASYSGGSMKQTSISGGTVTISFTGTSLTWITRKFPSSGRARVTLDGGTPVTVDLYSATQLYQQAVWTTGTLVNGPHKVVIAYSGQKNPSATFTYVNIDSVDVKGALTSAGALGIGGQIP